jgi:hypothetical protein
VIAKIPKADPDRFAALLRRSQDEERDRAAEDFRKTIFKGLYGMPAARDLPDFVVSTATGFMILRSRLSIGSWGRSPRECRRFSTDTVRDAAAGRARRR